MKRIHLMIAILLIALALPCGTPFVSAQEGSVGTPLSSVSAEEESDGIIFGFYGGGITREPATETMVQISIAHLCDVNDELILKKVEVCGENGIPVKTFDLSETLESVADGYDRLKSSLERLESTPDEEIRSQAATLVQELTGKSFSTDYFTLDLNDLKQPLALGDRVPITAKATFIHHGEALVKERSLSVDYQPGLTSSPPEGQTTSSLLELQNWKPGVQHVHTNYSWWDAAYFPYVGVIRPTILNQTQAAKNAGLSWIIITDHEPLMNAADWNNAKQDCQEAEAITGIKVMLGEEVGNIFPILWAGHYLAYDIDSYVDSGDGFDQQMIDAVQDEGGFGYIAHPYTAIWDEGGDWDDWSVTGYTGLEIINGDTACANAINKWTEILEDPTARVFAIGNSDAHWPQEVANAYVYCYIDGAVSHPSVYSALENGHSVVSNGPLITFTIDDKGIGDTVENAGTQATLDIDWTYGSIQKIEVYSNEGLIKTITDVYGTPGSTSAKVDVTPETVYIRLKGIFYGGKEAYTNPIWVNYTREDFNWGTDGTSLAMDGGDVDWTVTTYQWGTSRAEIETDPNHVLSGNGSARIYRANFYNVYASYPEFRPNYISFSLKKDGTSYAYILNGDGTHRIFLRIDSSEQLQYYNDLGYQPTGWSVSVNTWYTIVLENINWNLGTYDIRVSGHFFKSRAEMNHGPSNNGYVYYASLAGTGNFWIDNISSWVDYSTLDDFEWGADGHPLEWDGNDIGWTVLKYGSSLAEIETYPIHVLSGDGSAKIYKADFYNVYAYYPEFRPQYIKCCLKKDGTSYAYILNGDGAHRIFVRIDSSEQLQYYDDSGYHNTGWSVSANTWYTIALENINWNLGTYDICVSGHFFKSGVPMNHGPSNNGYVYYASLAGSGNFWIDNISS